MIHHGFLAAFHGACLQSCVSAHKRRYFGLRLIERHFFPENVKLWGQSTEMDILGQPEHSPKLRPNLDATTEAPAKLADAAGLTKPG